MSLAKARQRRDKARELLADDIDPSQAKRDDKQAKANAAVNTFKAVACTWMDKTKTSRATTTHDKLTAWLNKDVFPSIGSKPISTIGPRDVLAVLQKVEARGTVDSAHQIKQLCGRIFRFAVATGSAERDVTVDLKGALSAPVQTHYAAITEPKQAGDLMRSIHSYTGHPYAVAALKLAPLVFLRPGELRLAEWSEIDFDKSEWRVPAEKMKLRVEHMVPLSIQAVEILRSVQPMSQLYKVGSEIPSCLDSVLIVGGWGDSILFRMASLRAIGMRDIVAFQPPAVIRMPNRQLANYADTGGSEAFCEIRNNGRYNN